MLSILTKFLCFGLSATLAIDPLTIKGSKFFNSKTGNQFYFNGVAYQPEQGDTKTTQDPLVNNEGCDRDIAVFKDLGINSIRVYSTDYTLNHDYCMNALSKAGIYVLLDISTPKHSINREAPAWTTDLYQYYVNKVSAFSKYDNVAGYIIGNEITNSVNTTQASAFVKAALRDIKAYLSANKINIPVGYIDNDDDEIRKSLISYFNCGDVANARADFYGVNTYRWCGANATFQSSGYADMAAPFKDYSIPSIITEYGCNLGERTFKELDSILGSDLQDIFSGALMYQYSQESNNYGIVEVTYSSPDVKKLADYDSFKSAVKAANPQGTTLSNYKPNLSISTCPSVGDNWQVDPKKLPPTPSPNACDCILETLRCVLSDDFDVTDDSETIAAGTAVSNICGSADCSAISTDPAKGTFGSFSFCNSTTKLSIALNTNFVNQKGAASACSFSGFKTNMLDVNAVSKTDAKTCASRTGGISGAPAS
ncbi:hypothetical protein BB560_005336, partial [Smittium megazygosporum]